MPRPVAIFYHPDCLLHDTGTHHPECSERLSTTKQALEESDISGLLHWHQPAPAPAKWIEAVHSPEYRQYIEKSCLQGRHTVDFGDTIICEDSYHAALLSAGGGMAAVDAVLQDGYHAAFSLMRPPGHHASSEKAMGFCLFNNVAIAAHYAEAAYGIERICIFDWDVHHGNGTQDIFYSSPSVLFCSFHQLPLYPHSGECHEIGMGPGKHLTVNCPFPEDTGIDHFLETLEHDLLPRITAFEPGLFLISAGFDAHRLDPLAGLRLENHDYHKLTMWVNQLAERYTHGRVVSILEGGYHLQSLSGSVVEHVRALTEA